MNILIALLLTLTLGCLPHNPHDHITKSFEQRSLIRSCKEITDHVISWTLVHCDLTFLHSIYCHKVLYLLKATLFLEKDWTNVTRQAICAFPLKMEFNRNTSSKVLNDPHALGGKGLTHGFAKEGANSACHLLTYLCWNK